MTRDYAVLLCVIGILRLILWISDASTEVVDGIRENHFAEFERPAVQPRWKTASCVDESKAVALGS